MPARCPQCSEVMVARGSAALGTLFVCPACGTSTVRHGVSKPRPPSVLRDVRGLLILTATSMLIAGTMGLIAGAVWGFNIAAYTSSTTVGILFGLMHGAMVASPVVFNKDRFIVAVVTVLGGAVGIGVGVLSKMIFRSFFASPPTLKMLLLVGILNGFVMAIVYVGYRVVEQPFIPLED